MTLHNHCLQAEIHEADEVPCCYASGCGRDVRGHGHGGRHGRGGDGHDGHHGRDGRGYDRGHDGHHGCGGDHGHDGRHGHRGDRAHGRDHEDHGVGGRYRGDHGSGYGYHDGRRVEEEEGWQIEGREELRTYSHHVWEDQRGNLQVCCCSGSP